MAYKNRYIIRAKISENKFKEVVRSFCDDNDALYTSKILGLNRNTINRYFYLIRKRLASKCPDRIPKISLGEVNAIIGKFQFYKQCNNNNITDADIILIKTNKDRVYTQLADRVVAQVYKAYLYGDLDLNTINKLNTVLGVNSIVDTKQGDQILFGNSNKNINDFKDSLVVKRFMSYANIRLSKFYGISRSTFYWHLKECEYRFAFRHKDLYAILISDLKNKPLK